MQKLTNGKKQKTWSTFEIFNFQASVKCHTTCKTYLLETRINFLSKNISPYICRSSPRLLWARNSLVSAPHQPSCSSEGSRQILGECELPASGWRVPSERTGIHVIEYFSTIPTLFIITSLTLLVVDVCVPGRTGVRPCVAQFFATTRMQCGCWSRTRPTSRQLCRFCMFAHWYTLE